MFKDKLKFYKAFDGAKFPTRGSEGAAGLDFYIPQPTTFADKCFPFMKEKCLESIKGTSWENEYATIVNSIFDTSVNCEVPIENYWWQCIVLYNKLVFNNPGIQTGKNWSPNLTNTITLEAGQNIMIPSGIRADIPHGYCLDFRNKSGIASKQNLIVGAELVDEDYTGVMHLDIHNIGNKGKSLVCGMKICQAVVERTWFDDLKISNEEGELDKETQRGEGGFGSTGA